MQEHKEQDALYSLACLEETLHQLKRACPQVQEVFIFTDGASNYVSTLMAVSLHGVGLRTGVRILQHVKCKALGPFTWGRGMRRKY